MRRTTYDDHESWAEDRQSEGPTYSLGSTDVAAILGVYFYGPWRVWMKAQHPEDLPEDKANDAMLVGTEWEPIVTDWYRRHVAYGYDVDSTICRCSSDALPWLRVSPDALVGDVGGLEVKVPRQRAGWWDESEFHRMTPRVLDHVPAKYALQVNAMLLATGRDWWDLVACFSPHDIRTYRFHRDENYLRTLGRRLTSWRDVFLLGDAVPDYDESREARQFATSTERKDSREATADEVPLIAALADARMREKTAEADKKTAGTHLAAIMGDTKTIYIPNDNGPNVRATVDKRGALRLTNA